MRTYIILTSRGENHEIQAICSSMTVTTCAPMSSVTALAGGEAYFKFVPETEGDYTIYSYDNGDLDPVGTLYDSSLNEIDASEASPKARPTMSESAATRPSPGRPTTRPGARPER